MNRKLRLVAALSALSLGGCATMPSGPSVLVLPGSGKSFDQFQTDNAVCRQYARSQVGINANQASKHNTLLGTGIGALLGAALGAAAGGGRGAAIGAAGGAVAGTVVGAGSGSSAAYDTQTRYDNAYEQCMYAKGNRIPVAGERSQTSNAASSPPPPGPGQSYPPPNTPPPPGASPNS